MSNTTRRLDLEDGGYIEVRTRQTMRDVVAVEQARIARGNESMILDSMVLLERMITRWVQADGADVTVNADSVQDLSADDVIALKEMLDSPNALAPSSNGSTEAVALHGSGG